jgi:hypothetical protein
MNATADFRRQRPKVALRASDDVGDIFGQFVVQAGNGEVHCYWLAVSLHCIPTRACAAVARRPSISSGLNQSADETFSRKINRSLLPDERAGSLALQVF